MNNSYSYVNNSRTPSCKFDPYANTLSMRSNNILILDNSHNNSHINNHYLYGSSFSRTRNNNSYFRTTITAIHSS